MQLIRYIPSHKATFHQALLLQDFLFWLAMPHWSESGKTPFTWDPLNGRFQRLHSKDWTFSYQVCAVLLSHGSLPLRIPYIVTVKKNYSSFTMFRTWWNGKISLAGAECNCVLQVAMTRSYIQERSLAFVWLPTIHVVAACWFIVVYMDELEKLHSVGSRHAVRLEEFYQFLILWGQSIAD